MMKTLIALSLVSCATSAPAQFIIAGNPSAAGSPLGSALPTIEPIGGALGTFDNSITPTMRRDRQKSIDRTLQFIAASPEKWTSSNPRIARRLYAEAENKAKWARIEARHDDM